jgi:mycothiol synthase
MPDFRLIRPSDETMVMRGLRVLIGGPEVAPGKPTHSGADTTEKIDGFLAYAQSIRLDTRRQILAIEPDANGTELIRGMCLWVCSPGRTAMLFAPALSEFPQSAAATRAALEGAIDDATAAGVVLVQAMMEPADAAGKTVFAEVGLKQLATLNYMERRPPSQPPHYTLPAGITLAAYDAGTHALFADAIARTYVGTLDCPEMSGMRAIEDVIDGHKSVGIFDPQLWSVVLRGGVPVGCLLLAEIPARRGLELVYLGLVPEVRGMGLGRVLMQRLLAIASRRQFDVATLAVDAANAPAVRLYRRCGYASVASRVAMIRQLAGAGRPR